MTDFGDNTLHPLQIEDARNAAYRASEMQREVEDRMCEASRKLADAERAYRLALSLRTLELHVKGDEELGTGPLAITACEGVARGTPEVAELRHTRDIAKGEFEAIGQQAYRRGADRRDVDTLLNWSRARDLRTDTPPADWDRRTGRASGGRLDGPLPPPDRR